MQTQNTPEVLKVGQNRTVTLPPSLFRKMNVRKGDIFEVQAAQTILILTHKSSTDARIDEGLADIRARRMQGPFATANEALTYLHGRKKVKKRT